MSKKSKRKRAEEKRKNAKNKVTVVDATNQPNQGEQVSATDTTSQPNQGKQVPGSWVIADKKKAQAAAAKVAGEFQVEQEFFEYVKNYTNGFKDSLKPREDLNAEGKRKVYNRGRIEDFDKHMKLRDLLARMGMSARIKEEDILRIAYGSQNYSKVEKEIIYRRLNAMNPEKYPDIEAQQK